MCFYIIRSSNFKILFFLKKGPVCVRRINGNFDLSIICLLIILITFFCNIINFVIFDL